MRLFPRLAFPVLLLWLALAVAPAVALATPGDVASTRTFLKANYALGRSAQARISLAKGAVKRYIGQLRQGCHAAAAGSPEDTNAERLSHEVAVALNAIAYRANAQGIDNLARAVRGLHWSNPKVTRTVDRYVARLRALSRLAVPDMCADVKAWVASGYKTLSPHTIEIVKRFDTIEEAPADVSRGLLAPYLQPDSARTFALAQRLKSHLLEIENNEGAEDWSKILDTLALNP